MKTLPNNTLLSLFAALIFGLFFASPLTAGEAKKRWELMNQIRLEKFDLVLPEVMRENGVDMWITVNREGFDDPLTTNICFGGPDLTTAYITGSLNGTLLTTTWPRPGHPLHFNPY